MFGLYVYCVSVHHVYIPQRPEEDTISLELELQVFASLHVCAGLVPECSGEQPVLLAAELASVP